MDNENKFWFSIWSITFATLVAMVGMATYNAHDRRDKWEKAVANGADPMVVSCALFEQRGVEEAACLLMAQNRK
jgi:hypothetical protein